MSQPQYPLFTIENDTYCSIIFDAKEWNNASLYGLLTFRSGDALFYDAAGEVWIQTAMLSDKKIRWIDKVLAYTVYNPFMPVSITWKHIGTYEIRELKAKLIQCVREDDDVLTQFREASEIIEAIQTCEDFMGLLAVFENFIFADPVTHAEE